MSIASPASARCRQEVRGLVPVESVLEEAKPSAPQGELLVLPTPPRTAKLTPVLVVLAEDPEVEVTEERPRVIDVLLPLRSPALRRLVDEEAPADLRTSLERPIAQVQLCRRRARGEHARRHNERGRDPQGPPQLPRGSHPA